MGKFLHFAILRIVKSSKSTKGSDYLKKDILASALKTLRLLAISAFFSTLFYGLLFLLIGKQTGKLIDYLIASGFLFGTVIETRFIEKKKLHTVGLRTEKKDFVFLFIGALIAFFLNVGFIVLLSIKNQTALFPAMYQKLLSNNRLFLSFAAVPFVEELFYRGYLLNGLFKSLTYVQRSLLSAIVFSITHWSNGEGMSVIAFFFACVVSTILFGLLFNNISVLSGSIWMGLGFHWIYNFLASALFLGTGYYNDIFLITSLFLAVGTFLSSIFLKHMSFL